MHIRQFILFFFTGVSLCLDAQNNLPEITIYATPSLSKTGGTVTHIDSLAKQQMQETSLADLLIEKTPLFIRQDGRGALSTISFRGTASTHTDVLWNGISLKSPMLGQVDFSMIPTFLVNDIVLYHGGASLEQTSGNLGGVIALSNKIHWRDTLSGQFFSAYGSYKTFNEGGLLNFGNDYWHGKTVVYYTYSKNNFIFRNKNIADIDENGNYVYPLTENKNADYMFAGLAQTLAYRYKKWQFRIDEWFQRTNRSIPRVNTYEGDDYANISRQRDITNRLILQARRVGTYSYLQIASGRSDEIMLYALKNYISGKGYSYVRYAESNSETWHNQLKYRYKLPKHFQLKVNYKVAYSQVVTRDTVYRTGYNATQMRHQLAFSVQKKIGKRFSTTGLIREIVNDRQLFPLVFFAGADFLLSRSWNLYFKTHVSSNYHLPTLNDLYWQPGGNPSLLPERGVEGEAALSLLKKIETWNWKFQINIFKNQIENWIIWLPSPQGFWTPQNITNVDSKGSEIFVDLKKDINSKIKLNLHGNYAYASTVNRDTSGRWGKETYGKQLPYIPLHSFNFSGTFVYGNFSITWLNTSYSERYTTTTNDITLRDWLYPYYMNHLITTWMFKPDKYGPFVIRFKIFNLFNEEYRSVLGRPMPKRHYLLIVQINF